ncbi:hypothetical protein [Amorphus orientalis]|uniref:Uncharacterized protein n=1 Tax=Amorphus orientalis TaxID=649198 RepID=A0AAE3VLN5_9HYPH|nr:hypothetical protein [Amorphus orientalis]MDQ0314356.1 hypothetical protein [Amorphus orientalis]
MTAADEENLDGPVPMPKAFAVGFDSNAGEALVYGGATLIVIGSLVTVVRGQPAALVLSLIGLCSTVYFRPLIEAKRPQLGANMQGLYVERIGIIGWSAIAEIDVFETSLRTMNFSKLIVRLAVPLEKAIVVPETVPWWRRLMSRNWSRKGPDRLDIKLDTLSADPAVVVRRVKAFHRVAGQNTR